jgi:hypothetical protein
MSTQTLTKPRQAGAQEAPEASTALPPEKLLPAKAKLDRALADYVKAGLDLSESQAHLSRSEVDEAAALNNAELSDEESADAIAFAQKSRGVYAARVASRETTVKRIFGELEVCIRSAQAEFAVEQAEELTRVKTILIERVCTVIKATDRAEHRYDWMELMDYSEPYQAVRSLEPSTYQAMVGNADYTVEIAKQTLGAFEKLSVVKGATV